jgi:hypothetical protein
MVLAWEEPLPLGLHSFPILPQAEKKSFRKIHVAVPSPLPVTNVDEAPLTVDVVDMQTTRLGDPEPCSIGGHENGSVLDGVDGVEDSKCLRLADDVRESLVNPRPRDANDFLGSVEGLGVEELDGRHVSLLGGRGIDEGEEELADFLLTELCGGPHVEGDEVVREPEIRFLG